MKTETVEAEIVEDEFKAPVLRSAKELTTLVNTTELLKEYAEVPEIDPESEEAAEQYQYVLKGHKRFVKARTAIEKARKEIGNPAFTFHKKCIEIEKEILSQLKPVELKLSSARSVVEDNEKRKIAEAEEAERLRVQTIEDNISNLRNLPLSCMGASSEELAVTIDSLSIPTPEDYQEFYDKAVETYKLAMEQLEGAYETKVKAENADRLEAERKEREAKEQAEREAEERKKREAFEAEQAAFREEQRQAQETIRLQQEEINRQNAERDADELAKKQEQEAEEAKRIARKIEDERRAREEVDRKEREKIERAARKAKAKQDKELYESRVNTTLASLSEYANSELTDGEGNGLLNDIIAGCIPNLKWIPDEQ